ncbi:hypothetical protein QE408_004237 [Agrobacterium larrymoorei]|uniref:Uncharacterized protein n=1 Tax=Agrobacterium larrymoorei TaxID=160699 RepID=A0ABU0UQ56_9HYPH|nr:hypothetical protein [Agrobacterium larrymoorei]
MSRMPRSIKYSGANSAMVLIAFFRKYAAAADGPSDWPKEVS